MPISFGPVTSHAHRYLVLADSLLQAMRAGRYRPGDRLPSVRELCRAHGASLATVTHALHRLEDAGWIEARPRRGFFVRARREALPQAAPSATAALPLEARRQRLIALAAAQADRLSLGHLALPPALLPLKALRRLMSRQLNHGLAALASGSVFGSEALREQLARRLARAGVRVCAQDVVVTHGDGEALSLCLGLLARPGDRVAVAAPGSLRVLEVLAASGLQPVELPPSLDPWAAFLALERPAACVIDPGLYAAATGPLSDAWKQQLVQVLAAHRVPLIESDLMGELHPGTERPRPLKAFDADDGVIHCGSLACVTGTGFSAGFVVSARHHLRLRAARAVHGELFPQLTDQVLAEFLASDAFDAHLRALRSRLRRQVAAWTQAVYRHFPPGTRVSAGDTGYVLWVTLPGGVAAVDLLEAAWAGGCTFPPGAVFSSTTRFDACLRLTAAHPLDAPRLAGLQRLGEAASLALQP